MLTVVIATRDRSVELARTLSAMERLRTPPGGWRLIVVDNASTDATPSVLSRCAARLPLLALREQRAGMNAALNRALPHLAGDLLVKGDDDILPARDWLLAYRAAADAHPEASVFGGTVRPRFPAPPARWLTDAATPFSVLYAQCDRAAGACSPRDIFGPNWALRTAIFADGTRFDERFGPDGSADYAMGGESELFARLAARGEAGWFVPAARVEHVIRPAQTSRAWVLARAERFGRGAGRLDPPACARGRAFVAGLPFGLAARLVAYRGLAAAACLLPQSPGAMRVRYRARFLTGVAAARRAVVSAPAAPDVLAPARRAATITVCVCTHNRVGYVRDCLRGLAAQSVGASGFDIVLVDSASPPDAAAALRAMAEAAGNCRLVRLDETGISRARNAGLRAASGEYVAFIDDDAIPAPDWVACIGQALAACPRPPAVLGGRVLPLWEAPLPRWWPRSLRGVLSIIETEGQGEYRAPGLPRTLEPYAVNMTVHRATALGAGGFRDRLGRVGGALLSDEEVEFAWRLQDAGHSVRYDSRVTVRHQIQASRLRPDWLLARLHAQGTSTVLTRRMLGQAGRSWRELPRRLAVAAMTAPLALLPRMAPTRLMAMRWRRAYALGFLRGMRSPSPN
jgi:glycosyltransferase involved in cell wall biosynthesis